MTETVKILDIPFTKLFESEILDLIRQTLNKPRNKALFIATPNPEILLACGKDLAYKKVIQNSDLNIPDGNGLIWASIFLNRAGKISSPFLRTLYGIFSLPAFLFHHKNAKTRFNKAIHGSDLTQTICLDDEISRHPIFLLGNKFGLCSDTAAQTAQTLRGLNPKINVGGHADSTPSDTTLIERINKSEAEILLVGFGAPQQEIWLAENLPKLKSVKVAMGIGGTLDFIAGIMPRAPLTMRKTGLEWLYRLFKQPKRLGRIWNATVVFPWTVIRRTGEGHHKRKI